MEMLKQGKGTADHLLPLGDWFFVRFTLSPSRTRMRPHELSILASSSALPYSFAPSRGSGARLCLLAPYCSLVHYHVPY